ncbi:glycosyltransferase family 2 protein [bacterium]|nr:glycosyltransferase family 2 protein [bacterium]
MSAKILLAFLNYNTSEELRGALESLKAAGRGVDFDLVIIDNASTSAGEKERLAEMKGEAELLLLPENLGFAGAFNKVLARVGYDYFLLLNSDLILPPDFLKDLLEEAGKIKDFGLGSVNFVREDGSPQFSYGPVPTLASELINRSLFQKRYRKSHPAGESPLEVESLLGAAMLVSGEAVAKAGLMDERFFFFFEETEWCCRMRDHGFKVVHFPSVKATHLQGRSANKVPLKARIEFHISRMLFFRLRYGKIALFTLIIGVFLRTFINLLAYSLMTLLTLGLSDKIKSKTKLYAGLFFWYLMGAPLKEGLDGRRWRK